MYSCTCKCISAPTATVLSSEACSLMQGAVLLARAMKDYERRGGLKEGFSSAPADCVAYKFYRDVRPKLLFSVVISPCIVALSGMCSPCPEMGSCHGYQAGARVDLASHHKGACDFIVSHRAAMV